MTEGAEDRSRPRPIVLVVTERRPADPSRPAAGRCRIRTPSPDARVRAAIADGTFFEHPVLFATMESGFHAGGRLHVLASLADGPDGAGAATVELARRHTVPQVFIHLVLGDGSSAPVDPDAVTAFADRIAIAHPGARIATVEGRAWVRGEGPEGVRKAYDAIVHGVGRRVQTVDAALGAPEAHPGPADVLTPAVIVSTDGRVRDGDVVVDALPGWAGEGLTDALASGDGWAGFDRGAAPRGLHVVTVSGRRRAARIAVAYPPPAEDVPWASLESAGRPMRRVAWDYRLDRLAMDDTVPEEPAAGEWWEDEPAQAEADATAVSGDDAALSELARALVADERDAYLVVLAGPTDSGILPTPGTGAAADPARTPVVAVLAMHDGGADLEIAVPGGIVLRDGDLGDVGPTLADLAGWPALPAGGTSLIAR